MAKAPGMSEGVCTYIPKWNNSHDTKLDPKMPLQSHLCSCFPSWNYAFKKEALAWNVFLLKLTIWSNLRRFDWLEHASKRLCLMYMMFMFAQSACIRHSVLTRVKTHKTDSKLGDKSVTMPRDLTESQNRYLTAFTCHIAVLVHHPGHSNLNDWTKENWCSTEDQKLWAKFMDPSREDL